MDLEKFINSITSSTHQRSKVKRSITMFMNFLELRNLELKNAKDLSREDFADFFNSMASSEMKVKTRTALKRLAEWRGESWQLPIEPIHVERKAKAEVTQRILTDAELSTLNGAAALVSPRDKAMYMVLRDTGLNYQEFLALRVGDVLPGALRIRAGNGGTLFDRQLSVANDTAAALREYLSERGQPQDDESLWMGVKGPVTSARVSTILRNMSGCLQQPITIADLRHTFTLRLFQQGKSAEDILLILGLSSTRQLSNLTYAAQFLKSNS